MGSQSGKSEHGSESPTLSDWDQCLDFTRQKNFTESFLRQLSESLPSEIASFSSLSSQSAPTSGCWDDSGGDNGGSLRILSPSSTPDESDNWENGRDNSELMSEDLSRNSSEFGGVNVKGCLLHSGSTSFGHNFSIGTSPALEESVQFKEKNKEILPIIQGKLQNHWLQIKNQQLEITPSINISHCPMAGIKDETGTAVTIDFDTHRSILLDGPGKTVFARQHVIDWANNRGQLTNFKLVFFLNKTNFTASIEQALLQQASVGNEDPAVIWKIIQHNQRQVFVIVDDFDALSEAATQQVHDLLDGNVLPGAHVLATCKPSRSAELRESFYKHFSLLSFSEKQIDRFFLAFGKDIKSKVHQMLHVDCRDILGNPLCLHVLCVIADTCPELLVNNNITSVYRALISAIMMLKRLDSDFQKFFVELGNICGGRGSSFEAVKPFNLKDPKFALELPAESNETSSGEVRHQRNFTSFAIALYLSQKTDESGFGPSLRNAFRNNPDVSELFYRFFVSLIADKIDDVFHLLPRRLTQSWNLDLINILGEAGVLNDVNCAQFAANMPSWIQLQVTPAISEREEQHGFYVLQPIAVVNTDLNPGLNSHLCLSSKIKHHLLRLFELKTCPITFIGLDLMDNNEKCSSDFVLDLLTGINGLQKVTRVRVSCSQITGFICDVIAHLFQHVKRVEIVIKPDAATDFGFGELASSLLPILNSPKMEYLDICIDSSSTNHVLAWVDVKILCDLLKKCKKLTELRLKPVGSEQRIFDAILKLKLEKAVIGSQTKGKKKISSADSVLQMASNSAIKHLVLSGLPVVDARLDQAFGLVSNSQLKSLRIVDFTLGKIPGIDLSVLAPPNRCWDLLDFSGWRISCSGSGCGSIKCLVALGCECTNLIEIVDVFSVEKLVCHDELLDFSKAGKCPLGLDVANGGDFNKCCRSLKKLKVKCDNSGRISTRICNFGSFFPNLVKLRLVFGFEEFDGFEGMWEEVKKLEKLDVMHLVFLDWSKAVLENIRKGLELGVGKMKLTFDVSQLARFDFGLFDGLFDSIHQQLEKNILKVVQVSHKSFNYNEFLNVLEKWEKEKCLSLSVKLIKCNKMSKTSMTTVQLRLAV